MTTIIISMLPYGIDTFVSTTAEEVDELKLLMEKRWSKKEMRVVLDTQRNLLASADQAFGEKEDPSTAVILAVMTNVVGEIQTVQMDFTTFCEYCVDLAILNQLVNNTPINILPESETRKLGHLDIPMPTSEDFNSLKSGMFVQP